MYAQMKSAAIPNLGLAYGFENMHGRSFWHETLQSNPCHCGVHAVWPLAAIVTTSPTSLIPSGLPRNFNLFPTLSVSDPTMSSSEPSAKRKRTEDETSASRPPMRSDVWVEDGNIVLQAENTQFKFYRGLLARHSAVFSDIFSVPQPEDPAAVEGCAIVHLSDSAEDVRYMLRWLLEPRSYTLKPTVSSVLSALRMGHKYMIVPLWEDVVERLRCEFPTTLDGFYNQENVFGANIHFENENDILRLADAVREAGLEMIMPMLYYRIINECPVDVLTKGVFAPHEPDGEPSTPYLGLQTRITLLSGRIKVVSVFNRQLLRWTSAASSGCTDLGECTRVRHCMQGDEWAGAVIVGTHSPVEERITLQLLCKMPKRIRDKLNKELCCSCASSAGKAYNATQQWNWDALPSLFGLPDWKDLKDYTVL